MQRPNLSRSRDAKLHHFERLFDVQVAGLSLTVQAAIVVDAVGQVRIFLDFAQSHAWPNSVRRSRGNKESVARAYEMGLEHILQRVLLHGSKELFLVGPWLQAQQKPRARLRGNGVPHFRFSFAAGSLFVSSGISVVRMYLDGEFVLREDEFHENGEFLAGGQPRSAPVRGHCTPRITQPFSGERAGGDFAIDAGEPGFTERLD